MRVSTKGRYALRMMIEFGLNPDQCTKISQVAARQAFPINIWNRSFHFFTKPAMSGVSAEPRAAICLPESRRNIPSGMILRAAEGSLAPVSCLDEDINHCEHAGRCTTLTVWERLKEAIDNVVDNTTLADLIEEQKNMPDANLM